MTKHTFGKYGRYKLVSSSRHFWVLSALSIVLVFCVALLSRAQLRLSGELLAAGSGDDLVLLMDLQPTATVELIRETESLRLYILKSREQQYLIEVVKNEEEFLEGEQDEWVIKSVEVLRR